MPGSTATAWAATAAYGRVGLLPAPGSQEHRGAQVAPVAWAAAVAPGELSSHRLGRGGAPYLSLAPTGSLDHAAPVTPPFCIFPAVVRGKVQVVQWPWPTPHKQTQYSWGQPHESYLHLQSSACGAPDAVAARLRSQQRLWAW